jgi:hypothetical protein
VPYLPPDPEMTSALERFARLFRAARFRAGRTQTGLECVTGVDQTAISRIELAKAARFPLSRLLLLSAAMRGELPVGECPHDHACKWKMPEGDLGRYRAWRPDAAWYEAHASLFSDPE